MRSMVTAVSIGNTSIQVGLAGDSSWPPHWSGRLDASTQTWCPKRLVEQLPIDRVCWYVASVHRPSEQTLADWVGQTRPADDYQLLTHDQLPLRIQVDQPEKVGMDRLVAAVAVNLLRSSDRPAIVIDAGTAITVDLIDVDGAFRGGAILPGMEAAARALSKSTDQLPEVGLHFAVEESAIGKSTASAIRSGLLWGAVGAIRELVRRMSSEVGRLPHLFVTGGSAEPLAIQLGSEYRLVSELVLSGIIAAVNE